MALSTTTRNKRIREAVKKGTTLSKLAARYELTVTRVWQIARNVNAV